MRNLKGVKLVKAGSAAPVITMSAAPRPVNYETIIRVETEKAKREISALHAARELEVSKFRQQ